MHGRCGSPGISAADQAKLFQEFQQADNAITIDGVLFGVISTFLSYSHSYPPGLERNHGNCHIDPATLTAVDSAVMVIDGAKGIEPRTRKLFEGCRLAAAPQCESPLFLRPEYQVPVFPICFRHRLLAFASTVASGCVGLFPTASWFGWGCFLDALFLWRSIVLLIGFGFYFLIVAGHCAS